MTIRFKATINMKTESYWAVFDKNILELKTLSTTAKTVYMYLLGLPQGKYLANEMVGRNVGLSGRSVGRAIQELKEYDLYYMHRAGSKTYRGYLGNTKEKGSAKQLFERDMGNIV